MNVSKKDLYYIIVITAFILLAVVTYWLGGKGNEIVSYISFASALVSIVLASVAIFYSFVQNVNSQQNIGEMKTLVSEASRIITEKADILAGAAKQLLEGPAIMYTTTTTTTPAGNIDVSVYFDLKVTSDLTRLFAYFLLKSHTLEKLLPIKQFVDIVTTLVKMSVTQLSSHIYGILFGMACCLEVELNEEQTEVRLLTLPDNFKNHLRHHIQLMKNRSSFLVDYINQINDIC